MIDLYILVFFACIIFCIACVGLIGNNSTYMTYLFCLEILFLISIFILMISSLYIGSPTGAVFGIFVIALAAADAAVGLTILIAVFKHNNSISVGMKEYLGEDED